MGESVDQVEFSDQEREHFKQRLRKETAVLKRMLDSRSFEYRDTPLIGMEAEAWLVDENGLPTPENEKLLSECNDPNLVEEISQFNFEMNTDPVGLSGNCFLKLFKQLSDTWENSQAVAERLGMAPVLIGIHPLVRDEMLQPEYISKAQRYEALNNEIIKLREQEPLKLDIQGKDHFKKTLDHILMEAACTSIQIHIQANQEDFKRIYNSSILASIPSVAVAANSPFLYGHDLWAETRIPLFEQTVRLRQFRDKKGRDVGRVTFGTGYIQRSPLEIFMENLDGYTPVAPVLFDDAPEKLHHLRFHNGTLWRWNRPIVGLNSQGQPHFRVEQRAMAAGPSLVDMVANVVFSVGLTQYFAKTEKVPEESMTFTDSYNNFYAAAKDGLAAKVRWFGKETSLDQLILDDLIPKALKGFQSFDVDQADLNYYLNDVLRPRVLSGLTGAKWQRSFVSTHGRDFQALAQAYLEHQNSGDPVHQWKI